MKNAIGCLVMVTLVTLVSGCMFPMGRDYTPPGEYHDQCTGILSVDGQSYSPPIHNNQLIVNGFTPYSMIVEKDGYPVSRLPSGKNFILYGNYYDNHSISLTVKLVQDGRVVAVFNRPFTFWASGSYVTTWNIYCDPSGQFHEEVNGPYGGSCGAYWRVGGGFGW